MVSEGVDTVVWAMVDTMHLIAPRATFYWASGQYHYKTALQTSQTAPDLALFLILVAHGDHLAIPTPSTLRHRPEPRRPVPLAVRRRQPRVRHHPESGQGAGAVAASRFKRQRAGLNANFWR
jgi:hypothetical protein